MTTKELEHLKYPIGQFECPNNITQQHIESWISILEHFPQRLENLVEELTDEQLDTPYRPEGWTIRQVVHHLADSHQHSYNRFKWTLTEDQPIIKAYEEKDWAELPDAKTAPIEMSLHFLKGVHSRLIFVLKRLNENQLDMSFIHPETNAKVVLKYNIGMYAWHSNHHYAHIENVLKREGWR